MPTGARRWAIAAVSLYLLLACLVDLLSSVFPVQCRRSNIAWQCCDQVQVSPDGRAISPVIWRSSVWSPTQLHQDTRIAPKAGSLLHECAWLITSEYWLVIVCWFKDCNKSAEASAELNKCNKEYCKTLHVIRVFHPSHWQGLCHETLNQPKKKGSSCVQDNNLCFTFSSVIPRNAWQRCELHHKTRNALWGIKQSDGWAEPQHLQSSLQKHWESSAGEKAPLPQDANSYL